MVDLYLKMGTVIIVMPGGITEMRLKTVLSDLEPDEYDDGEIYLNCMFVPLRGCNKPLTITCPMCGLVMLPVPNKNEYDYCCPECGIVG